MCIRDRFMDKPDILAFLLEHGARQNLQRCTEGDGGHSGLHLAALQGHSGVVQALLAEGVELNTTNEWGLTPLEMGQRTTPQFELMQQRRQDELRVSKAELVEAIQQAGGKTAAEVQAAAEAQAAADLAAAELKPTAEFTPTRPAIVEDIPAQPEEHPPVTPEHSAPAATPGTPSARVSRLEQAMSMSSPGTGVLDRLGAMEEELLGEAEKGKSVPQRIAALETLMGL
eukprot:TRINITY_DN7109_c0_g1_i8.p2 TRINITY_DN7109_c0_g1~~TRINITY_DN7109_c0_g1_i8.p2  ORF type:complete len:228 (+),score=74.23 TRINITY_DN7109_c0_g1_i8:131-814(+)